MHGPWSSGPPGWPWCHASYMIHLAPSFSFSSSPLLLHFDVDCYTPQLILTFFSLPNWLGCLHSLLQFNTLFYLLFSSLAVPILSTLRTTPRKDCLLLELWTLLPDTLIHLQLLDQSYFLFRTSCTIFDP